MLGIEHSKKVLREIGDVSVGIIAVVKDGIGFGSIRRLLALAEDAKELIAAAPLALPELMDVDQAEAGALASEAYGLVRKIITAVAAAK